MGILLSVFLCFLSAYLHCYASFYYNILFRKGKPKSITYLVKKYLFRKRRMTNYHKVCIMEEKWTIF